jgi:hypothetical protein
MGYLMEKDVCISQMVVTSKVGSTKVRLRAETTFSFMQMAPFIVAPLAILKKMVSVDFFSTMASNIRAFGWTASHMETKEFKCILMGASTLETLSTESNKEKGNIFGPTVKYILASLKTVICMVREH